MFVTNRSGKAHRRSTSTRFLLAIVCLAFSMVLLRASTPANATVAFARQYHAPCSMCHTVFPQLNEFGHSFYRNNFRIPGAEKDAPLAFRHNVPFSFSTRATLAYDPQANKKVQTLWDDFQLHGSGLATRQDAFYLHHHLFENSRGGDIYEAWVQHAFDDRTHLNLRLGQFEQPVAFSPEIQRLTYSEYLVYAMAVGFNDFALTAPARGVMLTGGSIGDGVRFALTLNQPRRVFEDAEGGDEEQDENTPRLSFTSPLLANVFLRVQYQRKGMRLGVFGDFGETNLITDQGRAADHFARYGVDAELQQGKWRAYGLWLTGTDSNPLGTGQRGSLNGGFAGIDYHFAPRCLTYLRYDHAQSRSPLAAPTQQGPTVGVTGLLTQNWQLQLEYTHRQESENLFVFSTRLAF